MAPAQRRLAADATSWGLVDGQTVSIMDILDDHSRALVAARVDTGPTAKVTWEAFTSAVQEWGLPAHVMNDNGSCFTGRLARNGAADFERCCAQPGSNRSAHGPAIPNLRETRTFPPDHQDLAALATTGPIARRTAKSNSTVGARTTTMPDHTKPCTAETPAERWQASPPATSRSSHRGTNTCQRAPRPQSRPHRLERLRRWNR